MKKEFNKEQTLVVIKPDGVQRTLIGEIIKRFEQTGMKLVALKLVQPDEDFVNNFYTLEPGWLESVGKKALNSYEKSEEECPYKDTEEAGNFVLNTLKKYLTSGPVVAMVWQGMNSVAITQKITGSTEPMTSDVGTIRGDFVLDSFVVANSEERAVKNIIHRSGSLEEAQNEVKYWFDDKEIINYRLVQEQIMYDVNLDGSKE